VPCCAYSPRNPVLCALPRCALPLALWLVTCAAALTACHRETAPMPEAPQVQVFKPGPPALHKEVPVRLVGVAEPPIKAMPILRSMPAPSTKLEAGR
jgi:hypothetical protein